jgi:hypothetical protein
MPQPNLMAHNIYTRYTITGSAQYSRKGTQGRKPSPETRMIRTNITTSREAKKIITEKARAVGMSFSGYLELAGILYTPELVKT